MRASTDGTGLLLRTIESPMVDKLVGNAYPVVKSVADKLETIKYVAENMELLQNVASNLVGSLVITGIAGSLGSTVSVNIPQVIAPSDLLSVSTILRGGDNISHCNRSEFSQVYIEGDHLFFKILEPTLVNASFTCLITYR
jgi:hypothetical protein